MSNELHIGEYIHASVDIETLSTRQDAVILTLGACVFDPFKVQTPGEISKNPSFYIHFNVIQQIKAGYYVSAATSDWWHRQSYEARDAANLTGRYESFENKNAITQFSGWLINQNVMALWADPDQFDLAIIELHAKRENIRLRPGHNNMLDGSTIASLLGLRYIPIEQEIGFKHQAYYDAVNQAAEVQKGLWKLQKDGIRGYPD